MSAMKQSACYENYPLRIVALANILQFFTYALGAYLLYQFGLVWAAVYLLYVLLLEARLLTHCRDCYYHGKWCFLGRGKLAGLFFRKGEPKRFLSRHLTWKDIAPDFLVSLVPIAAGIALLLGSFSWPVLVSVVLLFLLMTVGNALVRGKYACKFCKQRELGCPAERLFNKSKKQ